MKSLTIKIEVAPVDDPKINELTPDVVAKALIDLGTTMMITQPPLTVYPERFNSGGVLLTLGETNE